MTVNKRKKSSRHRGSWTHGWGEKKKHRGAGSRGGRGLAGTGKRGDAKKPSFWKERYFGKDGFKSINQKDICSVNTGYINRNLEKLLSKNLIVKEGDKYIVDSKKLGFNKLLGRGKVNHKFNVNVPLASKKAIEIIKNAGGIVSCEAVEQTAKDE